MRAVGAGIIDPDDFEIVFGIFLIERGANASPDEFFLVARRHDDRDAGADFISTSLQAQTAVRLSHAPEHPWAF